MREIKFRGKNNEGSWHYGLLTFIFNRYAIAHVENENTVDLIEKESIGQYTGLKDDNGQEIYEGDILTEGLGEEYGKVVFDEGKFICEWENVTEDLFEAVGECEIVGNVTDNPELLEIAK